MTAGAVFLSAAPAVMALTKALGRKTRMYSEPCRLEAGLAAPM
jgi:hypothetical protein